MSKVVVYGEAGPVVVVDDAVSVPRLDLLGVRDQFLVLTETGYVIINANRAVAIRVDGNDGNDS